MNAAQKKRGNCDVVKRTMASERVCSLRKLGRAVPKDIFLETKYRRNKTDGNCSALYLLNSCSTWRTWDHGSNMYRNGIVHGAVAVMCNI